MGSNRTRTIVRACLWIVAAGLAAPVHGQFTFTQQTRRVFAQASAANFSGPGSSSQQQVMAPNFGPFNAAANAGAGGTIGATGDGRSEQTSSLLPGAISATGLAHAGAKMGSMSTVGTGMASWNFIVSFTMAEPTWVHLASSIDLAGGGIFTMVAFLELKHTTPSGPVLVAGGQISVSDPHFAFAGPLLLGAGDHTLTLHADLQVMDVSHTYQQSQIDLEAVMTVVPAPDGVLLVAGFGLVAGRRRRVSQGT